jgi:hypothetical protein
MASSSPIATAAANAAPELRAASDVARAAATTAPLGCRSGIDISSNSCARASSPFKNAAWDAGTRRPSPIAVASRTPPSDSTCPASARPAPRRADARQHPNVSSTCWQVLVRTSAGRVPASVPKTNCARRCFRDGPIERSTVIRNQATTPNLAEIENLVAPLAPVLRRRTGRVQLSIAQARNSHIRREAKFSL